MLETIHPAQVLTTRDRLVARRRPLLKRPGRRAGHARDLPGWTGGGCRQAGDTRRHALGS